jgi:hypothetical protein
MDEAQTADRSDSASWHAPLNENYPIITHLSSVLNFFRSMLTVDDAMEVEDYYIMGRLNTFLNEEAQHVAATKPLQLLVDRAVRVFLVDNAGFH